MGNEYLDSLFETKNIKKTKHRKSILEMLSLSYSPLSATEIYDQSRIKAVSINLSTIYRILEMLSEAGIVKKIHFNEEKTAKYEMNRNEHFHYLVCDGCKKIIPLYGCPLEKYEKEIQERTLFLIKSHNLQMVGLCPSCNK